MAKITGGMADISTEFPVRPEGTYPARIQNVEFGKSKKQKPMFTLEFKLPAHEDQPPMTQFVRIVTEKEDGSRNEPGLRQFKQIVENVLGEDRANDPDFDSDELIGRDVLVVLTQRSYTPEGDTKAVLTNEIKRVLGA